MGLKIKSFIITFLMITGFAATINAAWEGPVELISGTWGSGNDQFGIEYGDTNDVFAGPFYILSDGGIIIQDIIKNARYKVYSADGTLRKVLKCDEVSPNVYKEECNIDGKYIQTTSDGNIWSDLSEHQKPKYSLYSPTGNLIRTTTEMPLELGKVKEKKTAAGYTYTVQYPDITDPNITKTYTVSRQYPCSNYTRDKSGNLYCIGDNGVVRFDEQGNEVASVIIPESRHQEIPRGPGVEPKIKVIEEYGSPIISPTGDVYTWKRTPTAYSIIKWTWRP